MTSRHNKPYSNHTYTVVVFQNKRSKVNLHCYQNQREDKTNLILVHRFELTDNFICSSDEWVFLPASVNSEFNLKSNVVFLLPFIYKSWQSQSVKKTTLCFYIVAYISMRDIIIIVFVCWYVRVVCPFCKRDNFMKGDVQR